MASDEFERLLNEIGQILGENSEYPLGGTLLYSKVAANMVAPSIFENRGDHVLYRDPLLNRISYPLLDLWEEEDSGKRWSEMEYFVRDGKFDVTFTYADEIDPEEDPFDRRDRIVKRHFGDKPIVYPPWPAPEADDAQQFEI